MPCIFKGSTVHVTQTIMLYALNLSDLYQWFINKTGKNEKNRNFEEETWIIWIGGLVTDILTPQFISFYLSYSKDL